MNQPLARQRRGRLAHLSGLTAEKQAAALLAQDGLSLLAQRVRTPLGELDLIMSNVDWLVVAEVKKRKTLTEGACALQPRQSQRLLSALDYLLAMKPEWLRPNIRFDLIAWDALGNHLHVRDVLRQY